MAKITFMGAGSTVFARNVLGDCMCTESLHGSLIHLYDIDPDRLKESAAMLRTINRNLDAGMRIETFLGVRQRRAALRGADYVVNAIQVGGYEPSTVIDFEIPKKYGLRQTIGDTLGIGGIFRTLRTLPVLLDFARDMEAVCPRAMMINYSNPMAMLMMGVLRASGIEAVGLCHSVQGCARGLLHHFGIEAKELSWKVAGINHQSWLLDVRDGDRDLYPEIKKAYRRAKREGTLPERDLVRLKLMEHFGYYVTESSEHTAEYVPWFIKAAYPELIEQYNIPLDAYPRICIDQIEGWKKMRKTLTKDKSLTHKRSHEYASYIMEAAETDAPYVVHGNVLNTGGLIANLPEKAAVEVPCVVTRAGLKPCRVGDLPEQCAALNRTNINPQILTVEAILQGRKDYVYQAALLDPHTSAELSIDDTIKLCNAPPKAHGNMIPKLR